MCEADVTAIRLTQGCPFDRKTPGPDSFARETLTESLEIADDVDLAEVCYVLGDLLVSLPLQVMQEGEGYDSEGCLPPGPRKDRL